MQHLPVHWSEGLFLTAQHFQAAERHWSELLFRSVRYDQAYCYGLSSARYSDDAISNLSFQLDACEARSRRGTIVSFGEGEEPGRINLKDALAAAGADGKLRYDMQGLLAEAGIIRVYLAIPKLRIGNANTGRRGTTELSRFVELSPQAIQDENTGGNDQEVGFRTLAVRLFAQAPRPDGAFDDEHPDFELLPLAQVKRAGETGPELDKTYIPPVLSIDAWPYLQKKIMQAIYDLLGSGIERLAPQVLARGITLASQEPGDLDRLFLLSRLNEAYATLGVLVFAKGVHPFDAYLALANLVGQLSIFDPARRPPAIPQYDHDDLGNIFHWMLRQLKQYLDLKLELPYFFRPFEGRGLGMQVTFDPQWLGPDFQWYVGVHFESITAADCRKLLAPNAVNWKLGSVQKVEGLFQSGRPGLTLVPQEFPPKELPATNWIYFAVTRSGDAWQDVVLSQTLAMRYKDTLVDNRDKLEGQRTLVINLPPKKIELEFGLFAVPTK
jgi:type VI secretion system protein ImpJ